MTVKPRNVTTYTKLNSNIRCIEMDKVGVDKGTYFVE